MHFICNLRWLWWALCMPRPVFWSTGEYFSEATRAAWDKHEKIEPKCQCRSARKMELTAAAKLARTKDEHDYQQDGTA